MEGNLEPGETLGAYRIEGVAGRGGMGVVYRAVQIALDRTVALKLVAPELAADDSFRERFERESRVLASIDHPNVIPVFEAGEADGRLFISMRWVEGTDLSSLVAGPALAPRRAVDLVGKVAGALDAAHARGLVHRDVKPGNVLIEPEGGSERVFLTDFGLSKRVGSEASLTGTGQWVGTLDYVAPEQIEGRAVDARVDVYALGCVLFQALTGRVPFERDSDAAKLWAHMSEAPPSAAGARSDVPTELDAVITRAMAKDPDERFPSAGDLGRAAAAAIGASSPSAPERSVAVGEAAPVAEEGVPTRPAGGAIIEPPNAGSSVPDQPPASPARREEAASGAPSQPPAGPPPAAPASPSPATRRRRPRALVLGLSVLALLVLAGAATGALSLGVSSGGDSEAEPSERPTEGKRARGLAAPEVEVDRVDLGPRAAPSAVAADSSGAYVIDTTKGEVVKVDGETMQTAGRIKVGREPRHLAIDTSKMRLWATVRSNDSLVGLDLLRGQRICRLRGAPRPSRRQLDGRRRKPECPEVQDKPNFVAIGPTGDVVTLSMRDDGASILAVNPKTLKPIGKPRETGGASADLVSSFSEVYGLYAFPPTIAPFGSDLKSKEKNFVIPTDSIGVVPPEMAVGEDPNVVWVALTGEDANRDEGTVVRVDMNERKIVGEPIPVGVSPNGIVVSDGTVYVANTESGTVTRIDEKSGKAVDEIDIGRNFGAIAADGSTVWVAGEKDLVRIRPKV